MHFIFLFFQFSYLFFYFRFQNILLDSLTIFPLYITFLLNFILLIVFFFKPLQEKFSKTIIGSLYFIYIVLLSYLYFSFFNFFSGHDNVEYILFFLSIVFFLYYIFNLELSFIIFSQTSLLFFIYLEYLFDRLNNFVLFHSDILLFSGFFDNENLNFNFFNLIYSYANFIFYFIFIMQFLFLFVLFLHNRTFILFFLFLLILGHLFLMILFNNTFYHLSIIFLLASLFYFFLFNNSFLSTFSIPAFSFSLFLFALLSIANINYFFKLYSFDSFSKNDSLSSIHFKPLKKFITFSDNLYPLSKFNYFQSKSLFEQHKGIFSSHYINVFWNNKLIFSNIQPYNHTYVNVSLYDNLLISIFNNLYKIQHPQANVIFKYLFKDISSSITIQQGYVYLKDINNFSDLEFKVIKQFNSLPSEVDLSKDFFSFIVRDNISNPDFIFVE